MKNADFFASYIIQKFHEYEDLITNLKLQKLLYYVQGWHLGKYKKPIFFQDFEAWVHGPVIPEVYQKYRHNTWHPILEDTSQEFDVSSLTDHEEEHIVAALEEYGSEGAFALELMTHKEDPWIQARNGMAPWEGCDYIISKDSMCAFFSRKSLN